MIRHCAAKAAAALCIPSDLEEKTRLAVSGALDALPTDSNRAYGLMYG